MNKINYARPLQIKQFQEQKLQEQLAYIQKRSKFYQALAHKHRIPLHKIQTLEDLQQFPTTSKEDLQTHNQDFICVPPEQIIDYVTTSGTLGEPVTFVLTENDLQRLAHNEYLSFKTAGGKASDIYQLMTTIDRRFMAGLAYFLGVRKLGAGIIRVGAGIPELQWDTIGRNQPNALIAVPSFLLKLIAYAEKNGIDYQNSGIEKAICIGEPLQHPDFSYNALGKQIKEKWDIALYPTYASTEMSTAFTACAANRGGHLLPELIIVEVLDEQEQPVKEGEAGEIVITTLGVEGMPLLRFKTGDICHIHHQKCSCGRTTPRLGAIIGRKKQMIKYKGTTLYPPALNDILDNIPNILHYVIEVKTNALGTDEICLFVAAKREDESFEKEIKDHFRAKLRVSPQVVFLTQQEIRQVQFPKMARKPVKFIDRR